jgi:hypothetical protein
MTAREDYPMLSLWPGGVTVSGLNAYRMEVEVARALDEIDRLRDAHQFAADVVEQQRLELQRLRAAAAPVSPAEMNDAEHAAWRDALLIKFPSLFRYHGDDA